MHFARQDIVRQRYFGGVITTRAFLQNIDRFVRRDTIIHQQRYHLKGRHPANQVQQIIAGFKRMSGTHLTGMKNIAADDR